MITTIRYTTVYAESITLSNTHRNEIASDIHLFGLPFVKNEIYKSKRTTLESYGMSWMTVFMILMIVKILLFFS